MESRIQRLFLTVALVVAAAPGIAEESESLDLEPLIVREPERREVEINRLDSENFEVSLYFGMMDVEDFGKDSLRGLRVAYHLTEDLFVEASYGETDLGLTSFERLSGGARLLTDSEREMKFYDLSAGINLLPGEAFIGRNRALKGGLYAIAGLGSSDFGGDNTFTWNIGLGYRLIVQDWLAFRIDVRDHIIDSDLLGEDETLHNLEVSGGVSIFF